MKKILLVAGSLNKISSYEYHNFLLPLEKMGFKVDTFDFIASIERLGRDEMNKHLLTMVKQEQPELVFIVPQTDQFIPEVVDEIKQYAKTLGYFFDDMWRIEYSRFWARHFNFVTTSDVNGLQKFRTAGVTNVVYSPFACNTDFYCRTEVPKIFDVTFVGGYNPYREWYINSLRRAGIDVHVWGSGWASGMITSEEMINIFNKSRINLNLSNCISWDIRYLCAPFPPFKRNLRAWREALYAIKRNDMKTVEQVKGRHFEINACGGFQLSYYVEGLEKMYSIGEEITLYVSPEDMIEKTKYYLKHDEERKAIAARGYARSLRDHSMEKRFQQIFGQIGLG